MVSLVVVLAMFVGTFVLALQIMDRDRADEEAFTAARKHGEAPAPDLVARVRRARSLRHGRPPVPLSTERVVEACFVVAVVACVVTVFVLWRRARAAATTVKVEMK